MTAYAAANPESRRIYEEAAQFMPGGNTRSSLWHDPFPLCMTRGEGALLTDADGHQYTDFLGEFTAGIYGHSSPVVRRALVNAIDAGVNLSSHTMLEGKLAAEICRRFASVDLVRFTNSGTEANHVALSCARAWTKRETILVFAGGYHGSGLSFPSEGSAFHGVPYKFVIGRYNDSENAAALIEEHKPDLAAVLAEPMLGAGGCTPGAPEFLKTLRRETSRTGALLIFDEIQTARLSYGGRQSQIGIEPDLTTIGKFFGGGLPFGCVGGRREIMELFDPRQREALSHAGTFNNDTLTMAAGFAAVSELLTEEALRELNARGDFLRESLLAMFEEEKAPFTVTGLGSIMNIHSLSPGQEGIDLRHLLFFGLLQDGFYLAPRGLIALSFCITDEDIKRLLGALRRRVCELRGLHGRDADLRFRTGESVGR